MYGHAFKKVALRGLCRDSRASQSGGGHATIESLSTEDARALRERITIKDPEDMLGVR